MIMRGTRLVRPTSDDAVPPAPDQAAGAGRRVASRIVAFLRAESSLALAAFSIVPIRIIADTPNIGEVGHFGFLTQFLLVYILLVVVFAALGVVRYGEQRYNLKSSKAFLTMLFALTGLALILPDTLSPAQEPELKVFLVFASLLLYGFFLHVQTRKHVHFFTFDGSLATHHPFEADRAGNEPREIRGAYHAVMLVLTIVSISALVEYLSIALDDTVEV